MRKYSLHLVTMIFLIASVASCKKEIPGNQENNKAPIVYAGLDMKIQLHLNFTSLYGSFYNADRTFKKVEWRKVSGPDSCIIVDKDSLITVVSNMREGVYEFELTVTDKMNMSGRDSVKVEVLSEHERIFRNLVWIFPWYSALEVTNINSLPAGKPIKVFVLRDNTSEWKEVFPASNNPTTAYEYFIETRPSGAGMYNYGSLYIFYFGRDTNDTPDVKIQF